LNLRTWFAQAWPFPRQRAALAFQYQKLAALCPLVLADLGMRAQLWDNPPPAANLYEAGYAAGRRSLALETFRICKADPALIFDQVPAKPTPSREQA
jgi:hypothetical protein